MPAFPAASGGLGQFPKQQRPTPCQPGFVVRGVAGKAGQRQPIHMMLLLICLWIASCPTGLERPGEFWSDLLGDALSLRVGFQKALNTLAVKFLSLRILVYHILIMRAKLRRFIGVQLLQFRYQFCLFLLVHNVPFLSLWVRASLSIRLPERGKSQE